ncbi:MAG: SDR family NAD(P)-dependent oxidoreductase [Bacteroidota bacterium]
MAKTVLITGGSSGIGYELSLLFAKDQYQILWVALSEQELNQARQTLLQEYPETSLNGLALDLSQADAPDQLLQWVTDNQWQVDVLINNAGFGIYGPFGKQSEERVIDMLHLNIRALFVLTHRFYKRMQQRNEGVIINMASSASYFPMPNFSVYSATKAFVRHLTESLYQENRHSGTKIRVMVVCPGPVVDTAFQAAAGMEKVRTFTSGVATTTPAEVARDTYKGYKAQKWRVLTGWRYRLSFRLTKLVPAALSHLVIKREMERE